MACYRGWGMFALVIYRVGIISTDVILHDLQGSTVQAQRVSLPTLLPRPYLS